MISLINTETNRRLTNTKDQVLEYRSFSYFNLKILFRNNSEFRKCCLIVSSVYIIISRKCKIGNGYNHIRP